jgi:hypothetical protein
LTAILAQDLTAVSWRLWFGATSAWPVADVHYANFDIYLSRSVPPSQRSHDFTMNAVGPQTQVRAGPLTIPAGSFPATSAPHDFGHVITFTTPYTYVGDHLLLEFRHSGFTGAPGSSTDAVGTSTAGYGTLYSAVWTAGYQGQNGTPATAIITQFHVIPEPADYGALGGSIAGLARRRRRGVGFIRTRTGDL